MKNVMASNGKNRCSMNVYRRFTITIVPFFSSQRYTKIRELARNLAKRTELVIFAKNIKPIMDTEKRLHLEEKVVEMLRTVFDPEIPVDIYSLGLIYKIDIDDDANLIIDMTLTAPNCPAADFLIEDARIKLESIEGLKTVNINLVFEPEWDKEMMSEEAKLELGFL